jgi:hypothetical protein
MTAEKEPNQRDLNLYQKLAAISGDIGVIKKGGTNREQGYSFIEYAAVAGELRTLFAKYGVVIVPYMVKAQKQTREEVTTQRGGKGYHVLVDFAFVVVNADKPDDKFTVTWTGEATDYGDKATNKAATGALKYYLMRQFNISEKGEDPDETTPEQKTVTPQTKPSKPLGRFSEPDEGPRKPPQTSMPALARASAPAPAQAATPALATPVQLRRVTALLRGLGALN